MVNLTLTFIDIEIMNGSNDKKVTSCLGLTSMMDDVSRILESCRSIEPSVVPRARNNTIGHEGMAVEVKMSRVSLLSAHIYGLFG